MVLSKSIEERLQIWAAMTDFLYYQNIDLVKKKLRTDDRDELIMGYIEMCYGKELKPEYLEWIREKYKQTKQLKQDKQNGN